MTNSNNPITCSNESELEDMVEFNEVAASGKEGQHASTRERPTSYDETDHLVSKDQNARMWAVYGGNSYSPCEKAVGAMPAGQYTIEYSDALGIYFKLVNSNLDELVSLPDSVSESVIKEINDFWQKEDHFRKFGFLWKRGVLMWGPAGSGKTSTLQVISASIVGRDGLSIYVDDPKLAAKALKTLRLVEPNRPLIVMLEDIDAIIDSHGESSLLALMDGELQIDNVVFVATTNYPERLDKRFINRPSRFDVVKKIGMPTDAARASYLTAKNERLADPVNAVELAKWVKITQDFSVAHLKELIVSVEVFDVDLEHAVARLKTMMDRAPKSEDADNRRSLGFTG